MEYHDDLRNGTGIIVRGVDTSCVVTIYVYLENKESWTPVVAGLAAEEATLN